MLDFHQQLDTSGLHCPLPLLRLKKLLSTMSSGEVVHVIATDPASVIDFGVYAEQTGNRIVLQREEKGVFLYWIVKA